MSFFSYSQLSSYVACPQKYLWSRMEKRQPKVKDEYVPTAQFIGSVFAQLLDLLYREQWYKKRPFDLLASLRGVMMTVGKRITVADEINWPRGGLAKALGVVDDALPGVLTTMLNENLIGERHRTEYEINVPLDNGDIVTGGLDLLVEHEDGRLLLLDGKAGNPRYAKVDQLRLYALGLLHDPKYRRLPDKSGFWFFREGRVSWRRITVPMLVKFRAGVQATVDRLRSKDFVATPSGLCKVCQYRLECPEGQAFLFSKVKDHGLDTGTNIGEVSL